MIHDELRWRWRGEGQSNMTDSSFLPSEICAVAAVPLLPGGSRGQNRCIPAAHALPQSGRVGSGEDDAEERDLQSRSDLNHCGGDAHYSFCQWNCLEIDIIDELSKAWSSFCFHCQTGETFLIAATFTCVFFFYLWVVVLYHKT